MGAVGAGQKDCRGGLLLVGGPRVRPPGWAAGPTCTGQPGGTCCPQSFGLTSAALAPAAAAVDGSVTNVLSYKFSPFLLCRWRGVRLPGPRSSFSSSGWVRLPTQTARGRTGAHSQQCAGWGPAGVGESPRACGGSHGGCSRTPHLRSSCLLSSQGFVGMRSHR